MATSLRKRLPSQQQIYLASPPLIRRALANIEAWRRDSWRRYGNYAAEVARYSPVWYRQATRDNQEAYQLARLQAVVAAARSSVPFYRQHFPNVALNTLDDLRRLPILEKSHLRQSREAFVADGTPRRSLWLHSTSGSTGTPMQYYHDRSITRAHQAVADAILEDLGCSFGERRARISGVYVAPYEQRRPPFWIYIDRYRQLQCSAYHLTAQSAGHYLDAIRRSGARYGTGYATAWHLLATYLRESGERPLQLRAIITDSEGISLDQQHLVEGVFGCRVFQTYGLGEAGQIGQQCAEGKYHVLTRNCIIEVLDDAGRPVQPGETGEIVVTDLTATVTPFIRYRTGDLAAPAAANCACGQHSPWWHELVGRVDDRVLTPDGRWIGRLSHITKPGVGIRESQIVQQAPDQIVIRVVPEASFEPASMDEVVATAHRFLGARMQVRWELVEALPRMRSGKLRHVVREF